MSANPPPAAVPPSEPPPAPSAPFEIPVAPFAGTPDEIERQWFERCYRGRGDTLRQLTWRAVIMGSLLGSVLSLTNLYIGLKSGWGFGVAITACILSYTLWTTLCRLGIARSRMTILENNCMQSAASSAGYSTGGTLISAFAAYLMLGNPPLSNLTLMAWVFLLAVLGVTMAIPMKRQMINVEQLRFPSGIAAAETLQALHSTGLQAVRSAKALAIAGLLAAVSECCLNGLAVIDKFRGATSNLARFSLASAIETFNKWGFGDAWIARTVTFQWDPVFIAAGALAGLRIGTSMMIGAVGCWMIFVPLVQQAGLAGDVYRDLVGWTLWGGVSCMVTSGLLSFGLQWRSALRAFGSLGQAVRRRPVSEDPVQREMARLEAPMSWFVIGQVLATIGLAWLAHYTFHMPYWQSVLAVALSFGLALVACRVTGETDTMPLGPLGKVTQLIFGAISPAKSLAAANIAPGISPTMAAMNINLMAANVTAAAACSSADLLTDLKSGYLLGANPRKQFIAQFCGIFSGTVVSVLTFNLLVPTPDVLGSQQFPAPAAQTWRAVAEAMGTGLSGLHHWKVWAIVIGGLVGIVLPLLALALPKHAKCIPSAAAIGLSWTYQWHLSFLFFLGGIVAWLIEQRRPLWSKDYLFPVASGVIAGGSLMAVALICAINGPDIAKAFWKQLTGF